MVTNWPRPSTTERKVRENADNAPGFCNPSNRRRPSGRSRPNLVDPSFFPTTRPTSCNAGSAPGTRSIASASLPIGSAANRSAGLTSFVTPPLLTSTMRSTMCGY